MKITTAINFSGEYLDGYVTDYQLYIKRLADLENTQSLPLSKEELLELINELQKAYSTINNIEKSINKVTPRNQLTTDQDEGRIVNPSPAKTPTERFF